MGLPGPSTLFPALLKGVPRSRPVWKPRKCGVRTEGNAAEIESRAALPKENFTGYSQGRAYREICPMIAVQKFVSLMLDWPLTTAAVRPEICRMLRTRG